MKNLEHPSNTPIATYSCYMYIYPCFNAFLPFSVALRYNPTATRSDSAPCCPP